MLKPMSFVLGLFVSLSAAASIYDTNYAPRGFTGVDAGALKICQSFAFSSGANQCLALIQGKRFSSQALQTCGAMSFDSGKLSCLTEIANHYFEREAALFCSTEMSFDSSKQNCLAQVADNAYQAEAVALCRKMSFESSKLSCLETVKNRIYDTLLLGFCSNNTFDSQILSCLGTIQSRAVVVNSTDDSNYGYNDGSADLSIVIDVTNGRVIIGGRVNIPSAVPGIPSRDGGGIRTTTNEGACVVKQTGERVSSDQFYSLVSQAAARENKCAIARRGHTAGSGRVYDQKGRRVAPEMGGLTYEKVDSVKRTHGLRGCLEFICQD